MLKKIYCPIILIASIILIVSCTSTKKINKIQNKPLVGTYWSLDKIDKNNFLNYGSKPFIIFAETGNFNGTTGCNRFFGNYILNKNTITLENSGATKKMCANMETERLYLGALKKEIQNYTIVGDTLIFFEQGKEVLRFIATENTENPKE